MYVLLFFRSLLLFYVLVATHYCAGQTTAASTLNSDARLKTFIELLDSVGISPSIGKTIFAPTNDAWTVYSEADLNQWNKYTSQAEFFVHLQELLLWHLVTEGRFLMDEIFNSQRVMLANSLGNLTINQQLKMIDNVKAEEFLEADITTTDGGVIHVLDDVIVPPYLNQFLLQQFIGDQSERFSFNTMANLALWAGLEDHVNGIYEHGLTFLAPPNRRFNRAEIDVAQLLTEEMKNYTRDLVLCHMIKYNYHEAGIYAMHQDQGTEQSLVLSELGTHIWITTTGEGSDINSRRVRFQSTEVLEFDQPAKNGIFHTLDFVLQPPTISDFVEFTAFSTTWETGDCFRFFRQTLLSSADISAELNTPLTHFCPTEEAFKFFNNEDFNRLLEPIWVRHATEFLFNTITEGMYSRDELVNMSPFNITMLNGETYEMRKSGTRPRIKNGLEQARSDFGDMIAIDGYVHIMDSVITPTAVRYSIYDHFIYNQDFDLLKTNIDRVDMQDMIDRDSPLTMLAPNNKAFERVTYGTLEVGEILKRHIFRGLLFCDVIANSTALVSVENEPFAVEVRGENKESVWVGGARIYECDKLVRNGVLHYLDRVIGEPYDTVPPTMSPAPTITPQPTIYVPPTLAPAPFPTGSVPITLPTGIVPTAPTAETIPDEPTFLSMDPNNLLCGDVTGEAMVQTECGNITITSGQWYSMIGDGRTLAFSSDLNCHDNANSTNKTLLTVSILTSDSTGKSCGVLVSSTCIKSSVLVGCEGITLRRNLEPINETQTERIELETQAGLEYLFLIQGIEVNATGTLVDFLPFPLEVQTIATQFPSQGPSQQPAPVSIGDEDPKGAVENNPLDDLASTAIETRASRSLIPCCVLVAAFEFFFSG